jgi:hypothetical protein
MPHVSKGTRVNKKHKPQALPQKFKAGFLAQLDGRTDLARALRSNYDALVNDIGGKDEVGHVKKALAERFVWLEAILQTIEFELGNGELDRQKALGVWIQAVNSLTGLAKTLGIERKASERPWLQDTPTLPAASREAGESNDVTNGKPKKGKAVFASEELA